MAVGAAVAAIGTSWTGVGGLGFGTIAAGAKLVSIGATGIQAATQYVSGNNSGFASTAVSSLLGLAMPGLIGAKQALYGAEKTARSAAVRNTVGIAYAEVASNAMCK